MARYSLHQTTRAQHDVVLDGWCAGIGVKQLATRAGITVTAVGSCVYRARMDRDSRALKGADRKLVVDTRAAEQRRLQNKGLPVTEAALVAATQRALKGEVEPPPPPACSYRVSRSYGIEPVERLVANRMGLGSTGPGFVSVTLARIPSIDGHAPRSGR